MDESPSAPGTGQSQSETSTRVETLEGSTAIELLSKIMFRLEHANKTDITAARSIVNQVSLQQYWNWNAFNLYSYL